MVFVQNQMIKLSMLSQKVRIFAVVGTGVIGWLLLGMVREKIELDRYRRDVAEKNKPAFPNGVKPTMSPTRPMLVFTTGEGTGQQTMWVVDYKSNSASPIGWNDWPRTGWHSSPPSPTPTITNRDGLAVRDIQDKLAEIWQSEWVWLKSIDEESRQGVVQVSNVKSPTVVVYMVDIDSYQRRKIYQYQRADSQTYYGECSRVVNVDNYKNELVAISEYPMSSESYYTKICIIDSLRGGIKRAINLPNSSQKSWYRYDYDKVSNRLLMEGSPTKGLMMIDLASGKITMIKMSGNNGSLSYQPVILDSGKYVLELQGKSKIMFYNIRNNQLGEIIELPYESGQHLRSTSPSGSWQLYSSYVENGCFNLINVAESKIAGNVCPKTVWPGDGQKVRFDGWIEKTYDPVDK